MEPILVSVVAAAKKKIDNNLVEGYLVIWQVDADTKSSEVWEPWWNLKGAETAVQQMRATMAAKEKQMAGTKHSNESKSSPRNRKKKLVMLRPLLSVVWVDRWLRPMLTKSP